MIKDVEALRGLLLASILKQGSTPYEYFSVVAIKEGKRATGPIFETAEALADNCATAARKVAHYFGNIKDIDIELVPVRQLRESSAQ
jgi:hypothetical protein